MPKFVFCTFVLLALLNVFAAWIIFDFLSVPESSVGFLAVGEGDAELIRAPAGNILIDAGPDAKVLAALGRLLPFYDRTIDLFVLSHPDGDHFSGLFDVLERYRVRAVMLSNWEDDGDLFRDLLRRLDQRGILILAGTAGARVSWGGVDHFSVVYPSTMAPGSKNANDFSLVGVLQMKGFCFLFPGDIGTKQEKEILPLISCAPGDYRVLKVAHHGSRYSSSADFLAGFSPQAAVIEVGENNYGHPHPDVLERLAAAGARVFRTDLNGTVVFPIP